MSVVVIMSDIGLSERAAVELASLDLNIDDTIVLKNTRSTNELEVLPMHDEETLPGILNPFIPPASPLPPQRSG